MESYERYVCDTFCDLITKLEKDGRDLNMIYGYDDERIKKYNHMPLRAITKEIAEKSEDMKDSNFWVDCGDFNVEGSLLPNFVHYVIGEPDYGVESLEELIVSFAYKEEFLKKVTYFLFNPNENPEMEKEALSRDFLNLKIGYKLHLYSNMEGLNPRDIIISNEILSDLEFDVTEEEMFTWAHKNTEILFPANVNSLNSEATNDKEFNTLSELPSTYFFENGTITGTSVILYENFLKELQDKLGNEYYIILPLMSRGIAIANEDEDCLEFSRSQLYQFKKLLKNGDVFENKIIKFSNGKLTLV